MNYTLLFLLIIIFWIFFGIVSPTIRNILKIKNNIPPEKNIGGIIAQKIYKKK